jgi:hypothetical protein
MLKLRESGKDLDSLYSATTLKLDSSKKEDTAKVVRQVIYCNDIKGLIDNVIDYRGGCEGDYMIKVGIDGGGGFLKFCLNIIKADDDTSSPDRKRSKYAEGAYHSQFVDGGVKQLLIIAIVEEVKESYENLSSIMDLLKLDRINFMSAFDMKLANVFLGLGTHSSKYPCPWCELPRNEFSNPDRVIQLRTLGMIRQNASDYEAAAKAHHGSKALSAAAFKSCTHQPLVKNWPDETLVIDMLPVMELHLLLGITNRLYDHVDDLLHRSPGSATALDWSNQLGIRRPPMHGGEFNGHQCKTLLMNTTCLTRLLDEAEVGTPGIKVLTAFNTFNDVRNKCFGTTLQSDYKQSIVEFEAAYKELGIPITSKCHAVIDHVTQFLDRQTGPQQELLEKGLGYWSEQASESVHSDFKALWAGGSYKRDLSHKDYGQKLLQCVVAYSSRHR